MRTCLSCQETKEKWRLRGSQLARFWLPPVVRHGLNRLAGQTFFYRGRFLNWEQACKAADGYGDDRVIERMHTAALAVRDGQAKWERDGVLYDCIQPDFPMLAGMSRAIRPDRSLRVLDVGGAFGSSWLQARHGMPDIHLNWTIVEQERVVELAQRDFATQGIRYTTSLDEALAYGAYDLALFSSVLQYLPDPHGMLDRVIACGIEWLLIDRHPCSSIGELATLQHCPRRLYEATYPSWLFDCDRMWASLVATHEQIFSWRGLDKQISGHGFHADFVGTLWKRRNTAP